MTAIENDDQSLKATLRFLNIIMNDSAKDKPFNIVDYSLSKTL